VRDFLTGEQILILKETHRASLGRKQADRIKALLLLNKEVSYQQAAEILMLDETTIRRYKLAFDKKGIDGLLEDRYHGSDSYLSKEQETALTIHLRSHTYHRG
jgi:transposase